MGQPIRCRRTMRLFSRDASRTAERARVREFPGGPWLLIVAPLIVNVQTREHIMYTRLPVTPPLSVVSSSSFLVEPGGYSSSAGAGTMENSSSKSSGVSSTSTDVYFRSLSSINRWMRRSSVPSSSLAQFFRPTPDGAARRGQRRQQPWPLRELIRFCGRTRTACLEPQFPTLSPSSRKFSNSFRMHTVARRPYQAVPHRRIRAEEASLQVGRCTHPH